MKTTKTLQDVVKQKKCRKGEAAGTTKRGAYWLACPPIKLRRAGGDGIGSNAADLTWWLELRHHRNGEVRPTLHRDTWHQDGVYGGSGDWYFGLPELCGCTSIEEVVVALKAGVSFQGDHETCYSDRCYDDLADALTDLELQSAPPAPDEAA